MAIVLRTRVQQLKKLEASYSAALARPVPNLTTVRRLREEILKLRWELGMEPVL